MLLGSCVLCVEWESNNNSWDINVKFSSHTKCEGKHNGIWGWGIHGLICKGLKSMGGAFMTQIGRAVMAKSVHVFWGYAQKALVFRWVPFPLISWSQVLIPWDSWLVTYTVLHKGCDHSQCYLWGLLTVTAYSLLAFILQMKVPLVLWLNYYFFAVKFSRVFLCLDKVHMSDTLITDRDYQ